jgi:hypothetical protein
MNLRTLSDLDTIRKPGAVRRSAASAPSLFDQLSYWNQAVALNNVRGSAKGMTGWLLKNPDTAATQGRAAEQLLQRHVFPNLGPAILGVVTGGAVPLVQSKPSLAASMYRLKAALKPDQDVAGKLR